jgi:hypothetical protein
MAKRVRFWRPIIRSTERNSGTLMIMRMTLPNSETRAQMLATGMEHGMEASYVRLENEILSVRV